MKRSSDIVGAVSFSIFRKTLPLLFILEGFLIALPFLIAGDAYKLKFVEGVGLTIAILGVLSGLFTAREIIIRMEQDTSMLFLDAAKHTLYRYLTYICFLPWIGALLQGYLDARQSKNPFTQHEEQ